MKTFDATNPASMEPIPIKRLKNKIILVDGHTRAFAAFLHGFSQVPAYWETEELDWEAYEICLKWCEKEEIYTIADLKDRVIPHKDYEKLWYNRCEKMQKELEAKRKRKQIRKLKAT
ncbi:MAG: hypothetical protein QXM65_02630 [Candidatus Bathyarchaeia archaeon]